MEDSDQTPRVKPSGQRPIILNPKFPISNAIFHLFPNLSMELRAMIWEQSLTCERYIKVELCTVDEITDKIRRGGIPGKVRPLTGQYRILFRHPPKPSALFSTSVESRASAQRCYRIVLPCFYVTKSPSIIDSLQISEQNAERNPQGIVLSHVPPYGPNIPKRPQALIPGTLSLNPELDALEIDGLPQVSHTCPAEHQCLLQYRCSLPVAGATDNFSRQQDPRLIGHEVFNNIYFDLSHTSDLGRPYQKWMKLVEKLRVTTPCVYEIAYTTDRSKSPMSCESDAVAYLKSESERWELQLDKWEESQQEQTWRHPKETTGQFNGAVETVIGFWTFPIESHGQFSRAYDRPEDRRECFYDLSASQSELCLFDL
ncbi:hypothetical protein ACKAV7_011203 [Fusarium commune]